MHPHQWKNFHVKGNPERRFHDVPTMIEIVRYARLWPDLPLLHENECFEHRPYDITFGELSDIIQNLIPDMEVDDIDQSKRERHYTKIEMGTIPFNPYKLTEEVRKRLSPFRLDILDWYIEQRRNNTRYPALETIMCLRNVQLMRLVKAYAQECARDARRVPVSQRMQAQLTADELQALNNIIHLRVLGQEAVTSQHLPRIASDKALMAVIQSFISSQVRQEKLRQHNDYVRRMAEIDRINAEERGYRKPSRNW